VAELLDLPAQLFLHFTDHGVPRKKRSAQSAHGDSGLRISVFTLP
jgi:hypothetical protein